MNILITDDNGTVLDSAGIDPDLVTKIAKALSSYATHPTDEANINTPTRIAAKILNKIEASGIDLI